MPEWWIYYVRLRPSLEALRRRENPRWILLPAVQEQAAFVLASPDRDAQAKTMKNNKKHAKNNQNQQKT